MPNALPLLLIGGAAVMMLGGKKKSKGGGQRDIPLDKPVQVKKDGLTVNSGRSPVPPAVVEAPLEPFDSVQQVQEGLIAAEKPLPHGADGKWGAESQAALDEFNKEKGFVNEAEAHLATPDSLRALHAEAYKGTQEGVLANPQTGQGTALFCEPDYKCPPGFRCVALPFGGMLKIYVCFPEDEAGEVLDVKLENYAPGGFNEVYFSPDFSSMQVGGGWKFGTLEPWLYDRMREGKLLTFAREGTLFWEEILINNPSDFIGSTLLSLGLAGGTSFLKTSDELFFRDMDRISPYEKIAEGKAPIRTVYAGPGGGEFIGKTEAEIARGASWPPKLSPKVWKDEVGWIDLTSPRTTHTSYIAGDFATRGKNGFTLRVERLKTPNEFAVHLGGPTSIDLGGGARTKEITIHASSAEEANKLALEWADSVAPQETRLLSKHLSRQFATDAEAEVIRATTAKPIGSFMHLAKTLGIQLAFAAVVGGTIYGTNRLVRKLGDNQRAAIAESAMLAWIDFSKTHYVRAGDRQVLIADLPETVATQMFQQYVAVRILRFQMNTYE